MGNLSSLVEAIDNVRSERWQFLTVYINNDFVQFVLESNSSDSMFHLEISTGKKFHKNKGKMAKIKELGFSEEGYDGFVAVKSVYVDNSIDLAREIQFLFEYVHGVEFKEWSINYAEFYDWEKDMDDTDDEEVIDEDIQEENNISKRWKADNEPLKDSLKRLPQEKLNPNINIVLVIIVLVLLGMGVLAIFG